MYIYLSLNVKHLMKIRLFFANRRTMLKWKIMSLKGSYFNLLFKDTIKGKLFLIFMIFSKSSICKFLLNLVKNWKIYMIFIFIEAAHRILPSCVKFLQLLE